MRSDFYLKVLIGDLQIFVVENVPVTEAVEQDTIHCFALQLPIALHTRWELFEVFGRNVESGGVVVGVGLGALEVIDEELRTSRIENLLLMRLPEAHRFNDFLLSRAFIDRK